jgi:small-conductance mechanosensitive channel
MKQHRTMMKIPSSQRVRRLAGLFALLVLTVQVAIAQPETTEAGELDAELAAEIAAVDARIEEILRTRFAAIPGLSGVTVEADGGWLKLSGEVASVELIQLAANVAEREEAVLQVDNRLVVTSDVAQRFAPLLESLWARGSQLVDALPLLIAALVIVLLSFGFGRWLSERRFIERRMRQQPFVLQLLRHAIRLVSLGLGLLIALDLLGATALLGALLGTAGVAGIAFGFAFRDVAENYIAGILLSLRQPFSPKDVVIVDGHEGVVARLNSRATILLTPDGNHLRLPNALVFKAVIINYSRNPTRRFEFELGVAPDTDLDQACGLAERTLDDLPDILGEPKPLAVISHAGDSTIVLRMQAWVDQRNSDFLKMRSEAVRLVMHAFVQAGIEMPEPGLRIDLNDRRISRDRIPRDRKPAVGPSTGPAATTQRDLSPDSGVERVVDRERALAENDLLSPDAPQE